MSKNKLSVHVSLFKDNKKVKTFSISFKKRLIPGDLIEVRHLVFGDMAFFKNECKDSDDVIERQRKNSIQLLKEKGINLDQNAVVKQIRVIPITNAAFVDFSVDVHVL